jgi:hypothetical protein
MSRIAELSTLEKYRTEGGAGRHRRFRLPEGSEILVDQDTVKYVTQTREHLSLTFQDSWNTIYVIERNAFASVMLYLAHRAEIDQIVEDAQFS